MENKKEKKNWLEWTVTIISTGIVLFSIGVLIHQMVVSEELPPDIVVSLGEIELKNDGYTIPVTAGNNGDVTAKNVRIEFSLGEGPEVEKSILEFDYVPGKSKVKGWIGFSRNPENRRIKSHILGYAVP